MTIHTSLEWKVARQAIMQLSFISHAPSANFEPSTRSSTESRTGNRPPGGIDRRDDREADYKQKSADHFIKRLNSANTLSDIRQIAIEATAALSAWRHAPLGTLEPMVGDPSFRRWVLKQTAPDSELARRKGCSRQYINQIRRQAER